MFNLASKIKFTGLTGIVAFDRNGDRHPNYWLWRMNENRTKMELWTEVQMINPENERINFEMPARWGTADGKPPPDVPVCGFLNELCPEDLSKRTYAIIGGISAVVIFLIITVALALAWKKRKAEEQIKSMLWKIDIDQIEWIRSNKSRSKLSLKSVRSLTDIEQAEHIGIDNVEAGSNIAYHRGALVSAEVIRISNNLLLSRKELVELNQVIAVYFYEFFPPS